MNEQITNMTKIELLKEIRKEHGLLEETLSRLTHAQMLHPEVSGKWSIKDVLAHISTWERWMIRWTNSLRQGKEPDTPESWDVERMNSETYARVRKLPLAEVLEEFRQSYWDSLALAEELSEEQLRTIHPETWPLGPLWTGIAANTNWHYKEHREGIQIWLKTQKKER